jgi:hypothetical protein
MKRIVVVLFVGSMFIVGSRDLALSQYYSFDDNVGEVNVKGGSQSFEMMNVNYENAGSDDKNGNRGSDIGSTISVEVLIPLEHLVHKYEQEQSKIWSRA